MRIVGLIQARCSSQRLPGKVLAPLAGKRAIEHVIHAVTSASLLDEVILATTVLPADDPLVEVARSMGVRVFRGSQEDVLGRFAAAVADDPADVVVRHVADAPLVDPAVIDAVIGNFLKGDCDYASNTVVRSWPRGSECEVMSRDAFERANRDGHLPEEREHVTTHILIHPELFRLRAVKALPQETWPDLRLTLDTAADLAVLQRVFEGLYVPQEILRIGEVIHWLREHPEVVGLNSHIEQKKVLGRVF